ncbi:MAG TPA: hypothetical protein DDY49_00020 [Paenibacillaceae bacterium]|nr:hypothetical protein [Paenibacillaceae bacterium]
MSTIKTITAAELHQQLEKGEHLFILDVRNEEDFNDWKIEGKNVQFLNIPYYNFLEEDESIYIDIPSDKEVIVVCAKGGASEFIVETLESRNFKASHLEGGMLSWSQFYYPVVVKDEDVKVIQLNRPAKGCLSYMVISEGKALVVDPARHVDEYVKIAAAEGVTIEHIVDSHLHADHLTGGPELAKQTGANYYIHSSEAPNVEYIALDQTNSIQVGNTNVKVVPVETPGHTPGSVSFQIGDKYIMTGDTVFVGGLGRPDLGGKAAEWAQTLYDTVFQTISQMPDNILVLPSHYAAQDEINEQGVVAEKLGVIRNNNEIMRNGDRKSFTDAVAASANTVKPPNFEEIVSLNRGGKPVDPDKATELEIGPNRCAVHHGA